METFDLLFYSLKFLFSTFTLLLNEIYIYIHTLSFNVRFIFKGKVYELHSLISSNKKHFYSHLRFLGWRWTLMGRCWNNMRLLVVFSSLLGCFAGNLGDLYVFEVEISCFIMAMEHALQQGWENIWLESDSTCVLLAFKNASLVPIHLRNMGIIIFGQNFRWFLRIYFRKGMVVQTC